MPVGLGFGMLRLIGRSIWPLVLLHSLSNFGGYLAIGSWSSASPTDQRFAIAGLLQLAALVVFCAYGIWFVWRERAGQRVAATPPGAGRWGRRSTGAG